MEKGIIFYNKEDKQLWKEEEVWEGMYTHGGFMSMYGKTNTVL